MIPRVKPPRTLKRKAAMTTVRELRATLTQIADELAKEGLTEARRDQLRELQLRYSDRLARYGVKI